MTNELLMQRLAAADPAGDTAIDERRRAQLWAVVAVTLRDDGKPRRTFPRLRRRTAMFALAGAIALTTGALAATNVIRFGEPATSNHAFSDPHRGLGAILPHSARMLPVTAHDPEGGPDWGLRVLSTTRGVGCIQVGRVADGKLVAIGRDHAFNNDGRFHAIPVNSLFSPGGCTPLDAHGRIFLAVGVDYLAASAMPQTCYVLRFFHGGPPPGPGCKASSLRSLHYGLLGPDAVAVNYTVGGRSHRLPTAGPEGAYLIVTRAPMQGRCDCVSPGLLPWSGPITSIEYRDGSRCNLPERGRPYPVAACKPHGYAPIERVLPKPEDVRAPVTARLARTHNHRVQAIVSFRARVPITNARDSYVVTWARGNPPQTFYGLPTQGDVRAGQLIRKRLVIKRRGTYRVTVRLQVATGTTGAVLSPFPGGPDDGILVGRATVHVR
jgi:hypothetical protein